MISEAISGMSRKQAREQRRRERAKQMPKKNRPSRPLPGAGPKTGNPKDIQKASQGMARMAKSSLVFKASGQRTSPRKRG